MPDKEKSDAAGVGPPDPADDRLRDVNEQLTLAMLRVQEQAEELERIVRALKASEASLQTKNNELEKFHDMVVGRELKLVELEKQVTRLQAKIDQLTSEENAR
jgi:DNA repair ATPase RecN